MKKKLNKNGGFTLVEMLIVVAIIAILVAVSIPLINSSLERARVATDQANERAAKAEAILMYLTEGSAWYGKAGSGYYDANKGLIVSGTTKDSSAADGYGKCTGTNGHEKAYINVSITDAGIVTISWSNGKEAHIPSGS